jgi:hypothetical protein
MNEQQRAELERIRDVLYPATGLEDYDEEIIGRVLKDINALLAQDALYKMAEDAVTIGLSYNDWPKIGCVNHDCDKCKAVQEPAPKTWELTTPATALSGGGGSGVVEVEWFKRQAPDYAWPTIADYEKEVGFEVNDTFKAAWTMARTTNDLFKQMGANT